jgi:hypothetical protein
MPCADLDLVIRATRKWWFLLAIWLCAWLPTKYWEGMATWLVKHGYRYDLGIE